MRKRLLKLFLFCSTISAIGQTPNQSDTLSLEQVLTQFEQERNIEFYYRTEWIENQKVLSGDLDRSLPDEAFIDALLSKTSLTYYKAGRRIILLNNTSVVKPGIIDNKAPQRSERVSYVDENLFQDEPDNNSLESKQYLIGDIKQFRQGEEGTISGVVSTSAGPAEDVYIFSIDPFVSTVSDKDGRFSITLPKGANVLNFQSVTTIDTYRKISLYSNGTLNVSLAQDVVALEEVVVSAEREKNINSTQMGLVTLDAKQISLVPALLGEKDIIRVATSTAGVQNVGEGSAGLNIRGGKADQNLFLIDNHTVFTTNHFFGFFSAFNSRGVSNLSLYKNGIPAEYGGRLSSVFDIDSKEANEEKLELSGGIGLVTSQLQLEAPVKKANTTFLVNGRGTYSDFVLDRFENSSVGNNDVTFYDFMAKTHTKFSETDELSVTAYYSFDAFKIKSDTLLSFSDFSYENKVIGANWRHIFNDNLFMNVEAGNSNFSYLSSFDVLPTQAFNVDLSINEFRAAVKFDYYKSERLNFRFGAETKSYSLNPGEKTPKGTQSLIGTSSIGRERALEVAPYISSSYSLTDKLSIDGGIRYSIYNAFGPADINIYQEGQPKQASTVIGTRSFADGEVIHRNHGPEFRLQGRYLLNSTSSIKAGYNRTRQNIHLLLNAASIAPTDVWRLSGPFIKPQISDQISIGYFKNFESEGLIELSVEGYYKNLDNLLDFKTGAELQFNPALETDLLQGDGKSYGVEFSMKKTKGWLTGWFNYTYSRSLIRLDGNTPAETINGGEFYPTGYDKPHYVNAVANYKFTRRFTLTTNVVFSSGIPVTAPVGQWDFKGSENILYSDRNAFRIPNYFRVDLGFNVEVSHKKNQVNYSSWTFSIYNLLGRDNIYSIFFEVDENEVKGFQLSIFPRPIPTITYNFRF